MRLILVAVDGSDDADRAFETAAKLAKELQSSLYVMTVVDPEPATDIEGMPTEISNASDKKAELMLLDYIDRALEKHGVHAEFGVWHGYTSKAIIEAAKQKNASMIVVGTRGMGMAKELILGSVAHAVARSSTVPVLIAK